MPLQSIDFGTLQPNDGDTIFEAFTKVNSNSIETQTAIDSISNLVPYTGATLNVDLGTKTITATSIIKLGGNSSQFLKADGSIDETPYALDSNVVHLTGAETITGTKTFNKTGTNTSIEAFNTAGGYSVYLQNDSLGGISLFANNLSTGIGIDVGNSSTGIGISSTNSVDGIGIFSDNYGTGKGISSNNPGSGTSIYSSTVFGDGIVSNGTSSGLVFVGKNNGVNTFTVSKEGNAKAIAFKANVGYGDVSFTAYYGGALILPTSTTGSVYIGNTYDSVSLYAGGSGTFKSLAGTGTRNVVADTSGQLIISPTSTSTYKVYTAIISQAGTAAPTVDTLLENTLVNPISFSYIGAGNYTIDCSDFTANKAVCFYQKSSVPVGVSGYKDYEISQSSAGTVLLVTRFNTLVNNDLIKKDQIEIRVYN